MALLAFVGNVFDFQGKLIKAKTSKAIKII
jgi:hypothetical protein